MKQADRNLLKGLVGVAGFVWQVLAKLRGKQSGVQPWDESLKWWNRERTIDRVKRSIDGLK